MQQQPLTDEPTIKSNKSSGYCLMVSVAVWAWDAITIFNPEFSKRLVRLFGKKTIDKLDNII